MIEVCYPLRISCQVKNNLILPGTQFLHTEFSQFAVGKISIDQFPDRVTEQFFQVVHKIQIVDVVCKI